MLAVVDRENRAVCADDAMLVRARSRTLSKLYLGKQAARGLEAPSRMRCARMNGTFRAPCREGRPTRTSAAILIIYTQVFLRPALAVEYAGGRIVVKVPRQKSPAYGLRFFVAVITYGPP